MRRRLLMQMTKSSGYIDDGCVTFFGTKLGYGYDTTFPDGLNFVLYENNGSNDAYFYVGNFDHLLLDANGIYWITYYRKFASGRVSIGRWRLSIDGYSVQPWQLYANRNIGTSVIYYNVPIYSLETNELLFEPNYNEANY